MGLKIYNTLTGKEEPFAPLFAGEVRMYVCGVTVYDECHVGHARSLITFDVIVRYLLFCGFRVLFVRNFTDVDDKIIQRAQAEGVAAEQVAARYIETFRRDSRALGLLPPTVEPKATEHIPEMIELIRALEERGFAYRANGDVFFQVERFPDYGKLSRKRIEELEAGARVEVDERKRHPVDFALWKASKPGEPCWDSPWGKGRPGWHIECSAMSSKYLGQPFDIHGGGMDLIFPHHENEIAQSEAASGTPLARYWIHHALVQIDREKMSKSLGNIRMIQPVLERYDAAVLRHYAISSHYRTPLDFSEQGLAEAEKATDRIFETLARLKEAVPDHLRAAPERALLGEFQKEMDEDFNTPRALALLFEEIRAINRELDAGRAKGLAGRGGAVREIARVLGLLQKEPEAYLRQRKERWLGARGLTEQEIERVIEQRERARREKRWAEADRLRADLREKGILLEDTPHGTKWKVG